MVYSISRSGKLDTDSCQVKGWRKVLCTFQSPSILLRIEHRMSVTKTTVKMKKGSFHSAAQFGLWFWKKYHKVHVSSPWYMQAPKISTKHTKLFQPLNYTFMWTSDFYLCQHVYTYRSRREFQNIFERKLCNCFEQLLFIY